jgi:hypothetical protein
LVSSFSGETWTNPKSSGQAGNKCRKIHRKEKRLGMVFLLVKAGKKSHPVSGGEAATRKTNRQSPLRGFVCLKILFS